jgi:hypothetical protein
MKRRKFLRNTGLSAILVTAGGLPQLVGGGIGRNNSPLAGGLRPEEWIEKQCYEMYDLAHGFKTNVYTGYIIPRPDTGFRLVQKLPLNLKLVGQRRYPVMASAAFDHDIIYAYAERRTKVGPVRVDSLLSDTHQTIYTKVFLIELDGQPIGRAGVYSCGERNFRYTNWFGGVRHRDCAFVVKDASGFNPDNYAEAQLEIWEKKGAAEEVPAWTC